VISVAIMIAVEEPGSEFTKIGCPDRLTAQHTRGLLGGLSVIHQYEFHVTPPSAKQKMVLNGGARKFVDIIVTCYPLFPSSSEIKKIETSDSIVRG